MVPTGTGESGSREKKRRRRRYTWRTYGRRTCPVCGNEFEATVHNQRFCPPTDADRAKGNHQDRSWCAKAWENATRRGTLDQLLERKLASGGDGRIFGTPAQVRRVAERGAADMTAAGIEPLGIHDCRHTYASLMIAAGVNAKALSSYMGHGNIAITFDLYGHLMPGSHDEAAGLLDAFLARSAGGADSEPTAPRTAPHPEQTAV